jgi:hypothetical protein
MSVPPHRPLSGARTAFAVAAAGAAFLLVSAATRAGSGAPSRPPGWGAFSRTVAHIANGTVLALAPLFMLAGVAAILVGQVLSRRRRAEQERLNPLAKWKRLLRWGILLASLVAFRFMVQYGVVHLPAVHLPKFGGGSHPPAAATGHSSNGQASSTDWTIAIVLWIGLAAALVVAMRAHLRRRPLQKAAAMAGVDADQGIDYARLRDIADPREAVIATYAEMERTLAGRSLARDPAEAPREYLARIVHGLRRSRKAAGRLTGLYERARFSPHPVDSDMRGQAIDSLVSVDADVEKEVDPE